MKKEYWMILGAFVAGVVLAGRVRTLPLGNKLPTL